MAEREEPDLNRVREAMREHDERQDEDPPPAEPPTERDEPPELDDESAD